MRFRKETYPAFSKPPGFALVLSLVLMGFMVLLLLGLSGLVMVEIQVASATETHKLAKSNALLGMNEAIGRLQTELGPDQRTSARADIESANQDLTNGAKYWTGVWSTSSNSDRWDRGDRISWLVSGNSILPAGFGGGSGVTLVADPSSPQYVAAPKVPIKDVNQITTGNFSWWIGDEGIKARYNLVRSPATTQFANQSFSSPERYGIEFLFPQSPDFTTFIPEISSPRITRIESYIDLPLARDNLSTVDREHFHDISFTSRGLFANVQDGGLQKDLSLELQNGELTGHIADDSALPRWELLRSFLQLEDEISATQENPKGYQISPRAQSDTIAGIYPVITRFELNLGILPIPVMDDSGEIISWKMRVCIRPLVVLTNFHDVALTSSDYAVGFGDDPELGPPRLFLTFSPTSVADGYAETFTDLLYPNELQLNIPTQRFEPGESLIFTLDTSGAFPMPSSGDASAGAVQLPLHNDDLSSFNYAYIDTDHTIDLNASNDPKVLFKLRKGYVKLSLQMGSDQLQEIEKIYIARLNPGNSRAVKLTTFSGAPVESTQSFLSGLQATIMVKLPTETSNINNEDLAHSDKKGGYDRRGFSVLANGNIRASSGGHPSDPGYLWDGNPIFKNVRSSHVNPIQSIDDQRFKSLEADYAPLFHIPRSAIYSIAELQHLNFGMFHQPSSAIGNSWADPFMPSSADDLSWTLNQQLWDQYYFSGLAPDGDDIETDDLNQRYSLFRQPNGNPVGDLYSPSNLLIEGAFNINSTSVGAWITLLSSLKNQEVYHFAPPNAIYDSSLALNNTILRSPTPFGEWLDSISPGTTNHTNMVMRGFRSLSDAQIRNLAGQIVYQIRQRGPFLSLADFINRDQSGTAPTIENPYSSQNVGALQSAIEWPFPVDVDGVTYDPTGINLADGMGLEQSERINPDAEGSNNLLPNYPASLNMSRSRNAGGYLTQADLLTLIGSIIRARSDTFLIRSYGEQLDPLTGQVEAQAWCEAIVQRTPIPLSPDPDFIEEPTAETADILGRKFQIVSFRWLTKDEL